MRNRLWVTEMWTLTSASCWTNTSKSHLQTSYYMRKMKKYAEWVFCYLQPKAFIVIQQVHQCGLRTRLLLPLSGLLTLLSSLFLLLFPPLLVIVPILPLLILYLELESLFLWNNYFLSHRAVLHCRNILKILFSAKWGLFPKKPQVGFGGRGAFLFYFRMNFLLVQSTCQH